MTSNLTCVEETVQHNFSTMPPSTGPTLTCSPTNLTWLRDNIGQKNSSSPLSSVDIILGPTVVWTFNIIRAVLGILALLASTFTIAAMCCYYTLRENSTCRIVVSLAIADCLSGIGPFVKIAR